MAGWMDYKIDFKEYFCTNKRAGFNYSKKLIKKKDYVPRTKIAACFLQKGEKTC